MSVGKNFFLAERKSRLRHMLDLIEKNQDLTWRKIKGMLLLKWGIKGKTLDEYINELNEAGLVEWNAEKQNYIVHLS